LFARPYSLELLRNQLWQTGNFFAKALFLAVLTPWMIRLWGIEKYGLFALSSSLFVSLALLDGGVRSLTRVRLAPLLAEGKTEDAMRTLIHGLLAFMIVCCLALLIALGLCANDFLSHILRLPAGGQTVLLISGVLTSFWMTSVLALELLAADGRLSDVKAANTQGILLALPACSLCLFLGAGPLITMEAMILCLIAPNLFLLFRNLPGGSVHLWTKSIPLREALTTLVHGFPYYLTTIALIGKTHGLTFLISAMAGPAEAGIFYLLLRLSETLSNVASTSSETSVATLAFDPTRSQRILLFRQSWTWVLLFSLNGALALTLVGPTLWNWWLHSFSYLPHMVWPALALFGWMGGWSQMTTNSSMGLGLIQSAAAVCLAEAVLTIVLAYLGFLHGGFVGLFFGGAIAGLVTGFQSVRIAKSLQEPFLRLWVLPLRKLIPGLLLSGVILLGAHKINNPWACILALLILGVLVLRQMKQLAKAP
jgi:O-antigen/teichoic acid export membrane protein